MSSITNVNKDTVVVNPLSQPEGGTGGFDLLTARSQLDAVEASLKGAAGGVAITPSNNDFGPITEGGGKSDITVQGPNVVKTNSTSTFVITNFDIASKYLYYCDLGTLHLVGDTLYLTTASKTGIATLVINEQRFTLEVIRTIIDQPVVTGPIEGFRNIGSRLTATSTVFYSSEFGTIHKSSSWELSTNVDFTDIVASTYSDENNKSSWFTSNLTPKTQYFIRTKHYDDRGNGSDWSLAVSFMTRSSFNPLHPAIQYPLYASMDVDSTVMIEASEAEIPENGNFHYNSDWEVSTDAQFENIAWASLNNTLSLQQVIVSGLKESTLYHARVRYKDNEGRTSDWSFIHRFMTKSVFTADTPVIREPENMSTEHYSSVTVRSNAFHHPDSSVKHSSSHWQLAHDFVFATPVQETVVENTQELTTKVFKVLIPAKRHYVRVRHKDSRGIFSQWSEYVEFVTKESFLPQQPTIAFPLNTATDAAYNITVASNAFLSPDAGAIHHSSNWELSFGPDFGIIESRLYESRTALIGWELRDLTAARPYYVRVQHISEKDGVLYKSPWSVTSSFTVKEVLPETPLIVTPTSHALDQEFETLTFRTNPFSISYASETHSSTDWQLSTSPSFGSLVHVSFSDQVAKESWTVTDLEGGVQYWVRVRFRTTRGVLSQWSEPTEFTTKLSFVPVPCFITYPPNSSKEHSFETITIQTSPFQAADASDVHEKTHWQVSLDSNFVAPLYDKDDKIEELLELVLKDLNPNTAYYVRVRQKGTSSLWTPWSATTVFTTKKKLEIVQPVQPEISYPVNEGKQYSPSPVIRAGAFVAGTRGDVHKSSDWEISKEASFETKVKSIYESASYRLSWSVSGLEYKTRYYIRVRYLGSIGGLSQWSNPVAFETSAQATGLTGIEPVPVTEPEWKPDLSFLKDLIGSITSGGSSGSGSSGSSGGTKTDPAKPQITFPDESSSNDMPTSITFTCSKFASSARDSHRASRWAIIDAAGTAIVKDSGDSRSSKLSWTASGLTEGEAYSVVVQHIGVVKGASEISDRVSFTVRIDTPIARPSIVYPIGIGKVQQLVIESTPFQSSNSTDAHMLSDWEFFDSNDALVFSLYNNADQKTTLNIYELYTLIAKDNTYKVRVRYKSAASGSKTYSAWSKKSVFKTTDVDITLPAQILYPVTNTEVKAQPSFRLELEGFASTIRANKLVGIEVQFSSNEQFSAEGTVTQTRTADSYIDGRGAKTLYLPTLSTSGKLFIRAKNFSSDGSEPEWSPIVSVNIVSGQGRPNKEVVRIRAANYNENSGSSDYFGHSIALNNDGSVLVVGDPVAIGLNPQPIYVNGVDTNERNPLRGAVYFFRRVGAGWGVSEGKSGMSESFDMCVGPNYLSPFGKNSAWVNYSIGRGVSSGTSTFVSIQKNSGIFSTPSAFVLETSYNRQGFYGRLETFIQASQFSLFSPKTKVHEKFTTGYETGILNGRNLVQGTLASSEPSTRLVRMLFSGNDSSVSRDDTTQAIGEPVLNAVGVARDILKYGPLSQKQSFLANATVTDYAVYESGDRFVAATNSDKSLRYEIQGSEITDIEIVDGWIYSDLSTGGPAKTHILHDSSYFGIKVALNADGTILYVACPGIAKGMGLHQVTKEPIPNPDGTGTTGIGHVIKYLFNGTRWTRVGLVSGKGYGFDVACDATGDYFVTGGFKEVVVQAATTNTAGTAFPQRPGAIVTTSVRGTTGTMIYGKMGEALTEIEYIDEPGGTTNIFTVFGGRNTTSRVELTTSWFDKMPGCDPRYLRQLGVDGNKAFDVCFGKRLAMSDAGVPVSVGKNFVQFGDSYFPYVGSHPIRDISISGDGKYLAISHGTNRSDTEVTIYTV